MHPVATTCWLLLLAALASVAAAFHAPSRWNVASPGTRVATRVRLVPPPLLAKKKKSKTGSGGGGGFGANKASQKTSSSVGTISADKVSLEKQWDVFSSITDLEIAPKGDPTDEDYLHFEVVDVFVRCGGKTASDNSSNEDDATKGTKWFRIGKVCAADGSDVAAALTLQKGLIFWTAVHMRRELVAAGGRSGAAALELGFTAPASMYMGSESDGPLDEEEADQVRIAERSSVQGVLAKSFGFRPDWNPPGFTYKRREKAAMKKKRSNLEEIAAS